MNDSDVPTADDPRGLPVAAPGGPGRTDAPGSSGGEAGPAFLARVARLFTAPYAAFRTPLAHSVWITALVILAASQLTQSFLLRDLGMAKARTSIEENEKIPEAQKEKILEQMESGTANPNMVAIQTGVGVVVALGVGYLLPALLYWWGLSFMLAARSRFREVLAVTLLSAMILIVRDLIRVPLMLRKGSLEVYTSPAALVAGGSPLLVQALNRFDIFDLYRLFLLIAGLSVISGKPAGRTAVPVLAVWVLAWIAMLGCALSPLGTFMR